MRIQLLLFVVIFISSFKIQAIIIRKTSSSEQCYKIESGWWNPGQYLDPQKEVKSELAQLKKRYSSNTDVPIHIKNYFNQYFPWIEESSIFSHLKELFDDANQVGIGCLLDKKDSRKTYLTSWEMILSNVAYYWSKKKVDKEQCGEGISPYVADLELLLSDMEKGSSFSVHERAQLQRCIVQNVARESWDRWLWKDSSFHCSLGSKKITFMRGKSSYSSVFALSQREALLGKGVYKHTFRCPKVRANNKNLTPLKKEATYGGEIQEEVNVWNLIESKRDLLSPEANKGLPKIRAVDGWHLVMEELLPVEKNKTAREAICFYKGCIPALLELMTKIGIGVSDLKPDNIMRDKEGQCKLIDLGLHDVVSGIGACSLGASNKGTCPPEKKEWSVMFGNISEERVSKGLSYSLASTLMLYLFDNKETGEAFKDGFSWKEIGSFREVLDNDEELISIMNSALETDLSKRSFLEKMKSSLDKYCQ